MPFSRSSFLLLLFSGNSAFLKSFAQDSENMPAPGSAVRVRTARAIDRCRCYFFASHLNMQTGFKLQSVLFESINSLFSAECRGKERKHSFV